MSWLALVRAIHFAAAIQVIGAFLFIWIIRDAARTYACAAESTRSRVLVRLATISVLVTAVSGAAWFWLQVADMSEQSLTEAWTSEAVSAVLFKTRVGIVWWVRFGVLAVLAALTVTLACSRSLPRRSAVAAVLMVATANLISCAWLSHAAADPGPFGPLHLAVHTAHMLAVAVWVGGLIPLAIILAQMYGMRAKETWSFAHHVGRRFSDIALVAVALIVLTGIANTALLLQDASDLTAGPYARLLAAKVLLFALMLVLAAVNRQFLLPQLSGPEPSFAIVWLRRSVSAEVILAAAVLLVAGALGITAPGGGE